MCRRKRIEEMKTTIKGIRKGGSKEGRKGENKEREALKKIKEE